MANDGNAGPLDTHQGPRLVLRSIRVLMLDTLWSCIVYCEYGKAWSFHVPDLSLQSGGATLLHTARDAAVALDVLCDSGLAYSSSLVIMPDTIWDRIHYLTSLVGKARLFLHARSPYLRSDRVTLLHTSGAVQALDVVRDLMPTCHSSMVLTSDTLWGGIIIPFPVKTGGIALLPSEGELITP